MGERGGGRFLTLNGYELKIVNIGIYQYELDRKFRNLF